QRCRGLRTTNLRNDFQQIMGIVRGARARREDVVIASTLALDTRAAQHQPRQGMEPEDRGSYRANEMRARIPALDVREFVTEHRIEARMIPVGIAAREDHFGRKHAGGNGHIDFATNKQGHRARNPEPLTKLVEPQLQVLFFDWGCGLGNEPDAQDSGRQPQSKKHGPNNPEYYQRAWPTHRQGGRRSLAFLEAEAIVHRSSFGRGWGRNQLAVWRLRNCGVREGRGRFPNWR